MAGIQVDMSTWYRVFTNSRPFTLISKSNAGDTAVSMARASRAEITEDEIEPSGGVYRKAVVAWEIYTDLLQGVRPKVGDRGYESDPTVLLRVVEAQEQCNGAIWRLLCFDPAIAVPLRQRVDIYEAVFAQDATKSRVPTFRLKYAALPAHIEDQNANQEDTRGKRLDQRTFRVYVAEDVEVSTDDEVRCEGLTYRIDGWHDIGQLDRLMTLEVSRRD